MTFAAHPDVRGSLIFIIFFSSSSRLSLSSHSKPRNAFRLSLSKPGKIFPLSLFLQNHQQLEIKSSPLFLFSLGKTKPTNQHLEISSEHNMGGSKLDQTISRLSWCGGLEIWATKPSLHLSWCGSERVLNFSLT
jgi:hypothetical protein